MKKLLLASVAGFGLLGIGLTLAQQVQVPQVLSIRPGDLVPIIPGGSPGVQSTYATSTLVGNYGSTLPGNNTENALVGGDATTNLFGRGTSVVVASPGNAAYTANNWFVWSGTNVPLTVTKQTGAGDIVPGYGASFRINKASAAGTAQACFAQQIESVNSVRFQGQTAELSFHALAGPTFSAAGGNLAVYVITGTGTDEASANAAFSINAGGGSATPWTGPVVNGGTGGYLVPISTGWRRYTVAVPIAATATEIAVAICYTPVGTGTATDWFELAGIQFTPNNALATAAGTTGAYVGADDQRAKAFNRRPQAQETALQQRYFYTLAEPADGRGVGAVGSAATTATCQTIIPFPVTMRAAPTFTALGTALGAGTWKIFSVAGSTALASTWYVTTTGNAVGSAYGTWTVNGTPLVAGNACYPIGANGGSILSWSADL